MNEKLVKLAQALARGYCHPMNKSKVLDAVLIMAMVAELEPIISAEVKDAVEGYDALLFDNESCYKMDSAWGNKRKSALKAYGVEVK